MRGIAKSAMTGVLSMTEHAHTHACGRLISNRTAFLTVLEAGVPKISDSMVGEALCRFQTSHPVLTGEEDEDLSSVIT